MDGILNINKPQGITSFDVVARVKRITGERHTGHAGTLDPLATGVLPICLGQATKIIEFLFDETKTYRAQVELGKKTDTYDSEGKVTGTGDTSGITREIVEKALVNFRGEIQQTPPMYSALKHNGKPLYELARSGVEVERKSRPAQIHSLEMIDWQPPVFTLDITCGKGTYIRCLANDIGETLGCGAYMKSLIRLRVGTFNIEDALTLEQLEEAFSKGEGEQHLFPLDTVLTSFPAVVVNQEQRCSLIHGAPIALETSSIIAESATNNLSRVYTEDGLFVGMIRYVSEGNVWQPDKIFIKKCCEAS